MKNQFIKLLYLNIGLGIKGLEIIIIDFVIGEGIARRMGNSKSIWHLNFNIDNNK